MKYDVIIIGAGPGGIFAAYELMKKKPDCKIAVFEEGYPLEKRKCPIDGEKVKSCINCKRCSIMCGFGGAGAFSDGKYNITNDFGGTLFEYIGKKQAVELMKYVDEINMENGGEGTKLYSTAGTKFKKLCLQNKLNLKEGKKTTDDGLFTVETVSCLGACGLAPVMTVNDKVYPAMTPESATALVEELE